MMRRWIAAFATLLLVLLGVPRGSDAGILDFIWEMSGPQMLGYGYGCLFSVKTMKFEQCRFGQIPIAVYIKKTDTDSTQKTDRDRNNGLLIGFNASLLGSTARDSATQNYRWFEIGMLELGTGVAFQSYQCTCSSSGKQGYEVQVRNGVGVVYERFFGQRTEDNNGPIDPFNKFAFSVTPVDVALKRVAFGIKLRLYPEGFSDDQFKAGLPPVSDRPFETTVGFTFSWIIR
jgi:hypothetical protein